MVLSKRPRRRRNEWTVARSFPCWIALCALSGAALACSNATVLEGDEPSKENGKRSADEEQRPSEPGSGDGPNAEEPRGPNDTPTKQSPSAEGSPGSLAEPSASPSDGPDVDSSEGQSPATLNEPAAPPTTTCDGQLPASFVALCSSCHTQSGAANARYPDLYTFGGSKEDFIRQVRNGGDGMVAYGEALVADADLDAIFAYFSSGQSRQAVSTPSLGDLKPLYTADDAINPPVVFERDDGVLITRGAGRVRQRHELEGTFNPYGPHYFEDRSFGILVEDYTSIGESLIRVSYLPVGEPTDGTNFRAWKIYGDGNVFHANMGMDAADLPGLTTGATDLADAYVDQIAPFARVQAQEVSSNWRTSDPITSGDLFDFEFGVFLDEGAVREGTRTSYYSDTFRYQVGRGGFTANNADGSGAVGPTQRAQQGGDGTNVWLYEDREFVFEQMALNIQHENVQSFLRGRRLFHTDFETGEHSESGNPTFTEHAGKLGPTFVARSCETCHPHNGPGRLLEDFDERASMAFKLYDSGDLGRQLQLQEGTARVRGAEQLTVKLGDGTDVTLSKPEIAVADNDGQPLHHSARLARKVIGLGLLEAIDEATLLQRADPMDCDGDGVSGRASFVEDVQTGALMLGRFGWKAEKIGVRHQVVDALEGDLGVGSEAIPDSDGNVEIDEADLADLTAYMRLLSVPAQRDVDDADVLAGDALFKTVGCAQCHVTDVVTGANHPFSELRGQSIKPYTDLLLHDMGEDLADASAVPVDDDPTAPPAASEWRTPPLWGIGLYATVNGNTGLLHDGRAANVLEAILWHGGEGEAAKQRFAALDTAEREALIAFVESL